MRNSLAHGWHVATRTAVWQAIATIVLALAFLAKESSWSLAALAGGGAVTFGGLAAAMVALGGGVGSAGAAVARLLMGLALKWALALGGLVVALAALRLPGLPLLAGVVAATLALALANSIK